MYEFGNKMSKSQVPFLSKEDSSSSEDIVDQEGQQRDEVTSPENWVISPWVFPIFLMVMTVSSIAIGISFAWWVENSKR